MKENYQIIQPIGEGISEKFLKLEENKQVKLSP